MKLEQNLLIGFDLCDDFSQISCFNSKSGQAESICITQDVSKYLIPTVLAIKEDTKEWLYGEEALDITENETGIILDHLLSHIIQKEEYYVYGVTFKPEVILEKFFRKVITILKKSYPNGMIEKLAITLKQLDIHLLSALYEIMDHLGIKKEQLLIQSHIQSYLYYALSQKKELWTNDIGLFDFDEEGLTYHQISINRKIKPMVVGVQSKDFTKELNYVIFCESEQKQKIVADFEEIAKTALYKQIVTTLYMTGKGFEGDWANGVFQKLCVGRRVFKGLNLYTKGACYAAKEAVAKDKFQEFIFLSEEMIECDISINIYCNGKEEEMALVKAGIAWYDVEKEWEVIPDDLEELKFTITDILSKRKTYHTIALDGLPNRPNKMTRLKIKIQFADVSSCVITVKDLGFGGYYRSSNRIWEKLIQTREREKVE